MEIRTPQTKADRIAYLIYMFKKINPNEDVGPTTLIKGTTIEKLGEWAGPGYVRIKNWCEKTITEKEALETKLKPIPESVETKKLEVKFSGTKDDVTTFETGAVRGTQEGKPDFVSTISWTAFNRYARYMTKQGEKYGGGTFKKGIPAESYERSLVRHVDKYMRNKYENGKDELETDHLCAILFNAFGLIHEEEQSKLKSTNE